MEFTSFGKPATPPRDGATDGPREIGGFGEVLAGGGTTGLASAGTASAGAESLAALIAELEASGDGAAMTPTEQARHDALAAMQPPLTEAVLAGMHPAERETAERRIAVAVGRRLNLDGPLRTDPTRALALAVARRRHR